MRRSTTSFLSSFMLGMPYISSPPGRSSRSSTVTAWPARFSCAAAARPAGPEPITATLLPVRAAGGSGTIQPCSHPSVDDGVLDALDGYRRVADAEHARALAGRRAHPAGEFREVVGLVQALQRLAPEAPVDEVVPLGDEVVDRAARGHARRSTCPCGRTARRSPCSGRPDCAGASRPCDGGTPSSRARARRACGRREARADTR